MTVPFQVPSPNAEYWMTVVAPISTPALATAAAPKPNRTFDNEPPPDGSVHVSNRPVRLRFSPSSCVDELVTSTLELVRMRWQPLSDKYRAATAGSCASITRYETMTLSAVVSRAAWMYHWPGFGR